MQFRNFIKLALASAIGVAALQSTAAIAQETRSEISVQGQGLLTKIKMAKATAFKTASPTLAVF